jgi:NitT/TauT family transport system substrate-binding protein
MSQSGSGFTSLGKLVSLLLIAGLLGVGGYVAYKQFTRQAAPSGAGTGGAGGGSGASSPSGSSASTTPAKPGLDTLAVTPAQSAVPTLAPPAAYVPKDNTLEIELSEYAGYSGLIAANGGLDASENSYFFKQHGFKVKISLSEEESWSALNSGKMAASATTVDVLAVYGKQFQVVVPAQIGFSRGADGIVVKREIKRINALKGQVVAASQFTESEFFLRFLAQEAGLEVNILDDLKKKPDPNKINLVFAEDAFQACDLFSRELDGEGRLAACVTWEPKTSETAKGSGGRAEILTTNKNLLVIADVLIVNKGFAQANPKMVAGLVDGLLHGNKLVRDNPESQLDVIGKAFNWDREQTRAELAKVHLSNLPENLAFFSGAIDMAGSFGGIYQSAVYAYGKEFIKDPPPAEQFVDLTALKALEASGAYKDEKVAIAPIRTSAAGSVETDPLLSKDIRFLFLPNDYRLDLSKPDNLEKLESIKKLLQVSPGSTVMLRGHVDDSRIAEIRQQGGEKAVRDMALKAVELSKNRAEEIRRLLIERHQVAADRIVCVGRGWDEPLGKDSEQNRRVEVQWFTVE